MAEKKYYWLKLKRDFFKRHDVRIIEQMPNGKDYILFYLKMLLESIDHEGALRFNETIPYNEQMLSVITDTNVDIVKAAMKLFVDLGMVEILEDSTIYMNEVQRLIGSETAAAGRVRKHRENQKLLQCNTDETKRNTEIEIEKEIEIEPEKEKERKKKASKAESFDSIIDVYTPDQDLRNAIMEFIKMRQRIRKPMTNYALSLLLKKLDKMATRADTKIDILNQSIENSWQTVYPLKNGGRGKAQAADNMYYMPSQSDVNDDSEDFMKMLYPEGVQ